MEDLKLILDYLGEDFSLDYIYDPYDESFTLNGFRPLRFGSFYLGNIVKGELKNGILILSIDFNGQIIQVEFAKIIFSKSQNKKIVVSKFEN